MLDIGDIMEHPSEKNLQNIIQKVQTFSEIHNGETGLSHLNVSDMIEVGLVTEGKGIHRILGETIECAAGDIYIVGRGVPHGYFALNEQSSITVHTLSFSADECLQGEYADIGSNNYCYGVFRDNSLISYAMLSSKALGEVTDILDKLKRELNNKKEKMANCSPLLLIATFNNLKPIY